MLAFVVDLGTGDAVQALRGLWREVGEYERMRDAEVNAESQRTKPDEDGMVAYQPFESSISPGMEPEERDAEDGDGALLLDPPASQHIKLPALTLPAISTKPWFVVATKADLEGTQENFLALQQYLRNVEEGVQEHPSGKRNAWRREVVAVPVSAMKKEGVEGIPGVVVGLLSEEAT